MKKSFFLLLCCFTYVNTLTASSIIFSDLRCENLINPVGIDNTTPHFSWKIQCNNPMQQQYYEIQVASDSSQLAKNKADLWNSTKTLSSSSVMVPYRGLTLKSRMLCYWRVRVWNEKEEVSEWSPVQRFAIGILENDRLRGDYIGLSAGNGDVRSPLLKKTFTMEASGTAFLHVGSLGYHEVYINGTKVSEQVLTPAVSQLDKRLLIITYDVTDCLHKGENELVLWLGQGWYKKTTFGVDYDGPLVKAEMNLRQNGIWESVLVTDETWKGHESGYSDTGTWQALRFGGEKIDGQVLPENLSKNELDKLQWFPVTTIPISSRKETPQMCEPNRIQETLSAESIMPLDSNAWLIDIGKVITGWFELQLPGLSAGHEVTVAYTDDIMRDRDFKQGENDIYIASGKPSTVFCNKFNHHAFRYVKITNLPQKPEAGQIKAYRISGDYKQASAFECSDADLNAIHDMIHYTMNCLTFSGYMVDCPHLERAGYGGDGNSSTQALQTMYDVSPTFLNWLQAWQDVMREGGSLPHVAPNPGAGGGGPYWCGFIVQAPWKTYVNYNDSRLIERYYDAMKEWLGYVDKYTVNGLLKRWPDTTYRDWYLGDWLAPAGVDAGVQSSVDLVNNCFISDCLSTLQKMAVVLGRPEDAQQYADRKTKLNRLIHQTYYNAGEGIYATGSQLDMCYPMLVGVAPDSIYDKIKAQMIRRTTDQYKGHIAAGLVGVPILTDWSIRNKEIDFMYAMLKKNDYPGYLYMLNHGATTTWEYWSGERSRVHNCYNGIGSWFYQAIGGIRPDENNPGYRHVYIDPQIPRGVTWAKTSKETPYGTITVNWELKENRQIMHVALPVGVQASVAVPEKIESFTVNRKEIKTVDSFLSLKTGVYDLEFKRTN
ncbi:MAG: glycoside hydrolase family 78 protein [Tannerella sp.]|jgi:alpha-L-rhamnosidase|nr:glycoside hydrolase family 78 protein [Tannerella sp.]